ncbi:hypothetical protein F4703DRAFT_1788209 [Phycomyces blakesleeanus]
MNPAGYETHVFHIDITSNTTENIEQQDEDGVTTQTMQNTQTTKATTTERTDCRQSFTIYFAEVLWYCSMQELFHAQNLQRFRTVKYVRDKFQKIKRYFQRVVVDTTRTGSDSAFPQERYLFYDNMKDIILCDLSFWPPALHKLDTIVDSALRNLMDMISMKIEHYTQLLLLR